MNGNYAKRNLSILGLDPAMYFKVAGKFILKIKDDFEDQKPNSADEKKIRAITQSEILRSGEC